MRQNIRMQLWVTAEMRYMLILKPELWSLLPLYLFEESKTGEIS